MKHQTRILAGTAIGLFMASEVFAGAPASPGSAMPPATDAFVLAQAEKQPPVDDVAPEEQRPRKKQRTEKAPERRAPAEAAAPEEQRPRKKQQAERAPERQAPAGAAAREEQRPRKKQQAERAPERQAPAGAAAPEEQRPRKKQQAERAPERRAPAETTAPEEQRPRKKQQAERAPERQAPAEAAAPEEQRPRKKQQAERAPEGQAPAEAAAPEEQRPRKKQQAEQAPGKKAPAEEQRLRREQRAEQPGAAPVESEDPTGKPGRAERAQQEPEPEMMPVPKPRGKAPEQAGEQRPGKAAPVLDSQKQRPPSERPAKQPTTEEQARPADSTRPGETDRSEQPADQARPGRPAQPERQAEPSAPPVDDGSAQAEIRRPAEIAPVTAEEGRRIERRPEDPFRERPRDAQVVREFGDRVVIEIDNRVIVESNDRPRIARDASDVYYEELPRNRTREVIIREDGTRIVTIRDRYGDVVRRSRIGPDDHEYVLVYVEDDYYDRVGEWRDPGLDLPPMRLTIPVEEYILDADQVEDPDLYYSFLDQPPVEPVERYYSVDEVKRSARIRDKTRRVDLDTVTFEFGSASIPESEISRLEGVAQAIERLLEKNPAETFLIEGHTDAVGSDFANLALSDRRAEAVAEALTNVFAIPPENMATQGYGEQYLKVNTQSPERENRRVAIRRITPLVAPVASAE